MTKPYIQQRMQRYHGVKPSAQRHERQHDAHDLAKLTPMDAAEVEHRQHCARQKARGVQDGHRALQPQRERAHRHTEDVAGEPCDGLHGVAEQEHRQEYDVLNQQRPSLPLSCNRRNHAKGAPIRQTLRCRAIGTATLQAGQRRTRGGGADTPMPRDLRNDARALRCRRRFDVAGPAFPQTGMPTCSAAPSAAYPRLHRYP